ncbi:MAG: GNAT family N-acetyltransferase [Bacilli bacterium]|nr:GNAT family N-acetyltransferase [Bacilli bacterium]MBN2876863.1 GNAT family N-acetyltransferase [Bacilli bacterium]
MKDKIEIKAFLDERNIDEIKDLEEDSSNYDSIAFKFELDFKLSQAKENHTKDLNVPINEFLYYHNGLLVGYVGICDFGSGVAEVSGTVRPGYRNSKIFTKLIQEAEKELKYQGKTNYLLLTDERSKTGLQWMKSHDASLDHIEYEMSLSTQSDFTKINENVTLVVANPKDIDYIKRLNRVFETEDEVETTHTNLEFKSDDNMEIYLFKRNHEIIGKIHLQFIEDAAWIYGFVIDPSLRGKGYGLSSLINTIHFLKDREIKMIYLQVDSENPAALSLYRKVGFQELYSMAYYTVNIS